MVLTPSYQYEYSCDFFTRKRFSSPTRVIFKAIAQQYILTTISSFWTCAHRHHNYATVIQKSVPFGSDIKISPQCVVWSSHHISRWKAVQITWTLWITVVQLLVALKGMAAPFVEVACFGLPTRVASSNIKTVILVPE